MSAIIGEFTVEQLQSIEKDWYSQGYLPALPENGAALRQIREALTRPEMSALAFIGTWCPDCHAHFPRFMKLMDQAGVPHSKLRLFGVGREKRLLPWTEDFRIARLPTFVFLRDGLEIGRIIETPKEDLMSDTASILKESLQEKYSPQSACFGCGPANPQGLRIRSFVSPTNPEEVIAEWRAEKHHEAFPGMLNGGIIGALLDCHCNWTAAYHLMKSAGLDHPPCTVTADYSIQLKRPTPTDGPIHLSAHVVESKEDRATIEGTLTAGGKVCATCRGTFVAVKPGHPAYHRW